MNLNMNGNKDEFVLWMIILLIIGAFIFFMPDIERLIFGRAKKVNYDTKEIIEQKQKEQKRVNKQVNNDSIKNNKKTNTKTKTNTKKTNSTKGRTYTCTLEKKESFYTQNETTKYVFDASGNTLTVDSNIVVNVDNLDSYNQMKNTYEGVTNKFNSLDKEFKTYYGVNVNTDDSNKIIKIVTNVTNYAKAISYINSYNKEHPDDKLTISSYATYAEAEINMKSDGYTCKLS